MKRSELRQLIKEELELYEQETALFNSIQANYGLQMVRNKELLKLVSKLVKSRVVPSLQLKRLKDSIDSIDEVMGQIMSMWQ